MSTREIPHKWRNRILVIGGVVLGLCVCVGALASRGGTNRQRPTATEPSALATATSAPASATETILPSETTEPTRTPQLPTATRTEIPTLTPPPATSTPEPTPTGTAVPAPTQPLPTDTRQPTATGDSAGTVIGVIDGDTIDVDINGVVYRVRYIGIDTPESGQTCGAEATGANAGMVSGQAVTLVKDVSEIDRFGRLLRYVYVGDLFVNAELVSRGYAEAVAYPPDVRYAEHFESLEAQARAANLNCYGLGVFGGFIPATATVAVVVPTQPAPVPTQPLPTAAANCHPSYPTVCIPPPPPDLDCGDIPFRRFQVLPPDPHNFDGDHDGIGCESG